MEIEIENSKNIRSIEYSNNVLYIRFKRASGRYAYIGVPYEQYEALLNAASCGKYFHSHIEKNYPYQHIGG